MKLVAYDKKKINGSFVYGQNMELVEQFRNSDLDCVKVEGWTHSNASVCVACLNATIKRCRIFTIKAISRNGEVFLVKI